MISKPYANNTDANNLDIHKYAEDLLRTFCFITTAQA